MMERLAMALGAAQRPRSDCSTSARFIDLSYSQSIRMWCHMCCEGTRKKNDRTGKQRSIAIRNAQPHRTSVLQLENFMDVLFSLSNQYEDEGVRSLVNLEAFWSLPSL
jgi:hypothetical protein